MYDGEVYGKINNEEKSGNILLLASYGLYSFYSICNGIFNHTSLCEFHSKKVTASSVWAFADTSGGRGVDSASYAAGFLPLLLTTHGKANLAKFPGISFRVFVTEFDKNGRISSVLQ